MKPTYCGGAEALKVCSKFVGQNMTVAVKTEISVNPCLLMFQLLGLISKPG